MKRIIKLTESDLQKIVKRVVKEAEKGVEPWLTGSNPVGNEKIYNSIKNSTLDPDDFEFDFVFRDTFNDSGFPKVFFVKNGNSFDVWYSETRLPEVGPAEGIGLLPRKDELGFTIVKGNNGLKLVYNEKLQNGRLAGDLINKKTGEKMTVVFIVKMKTSRV